MSTVNIRTTQNVDINYQPASLSDRIFAFLLDGLIMAAYVIICIYILATFFNDPGWIAIVFFLPIFFYHLTSEVFFNGQSIGKRQMKIRVLKLDGTPPELGAYLLRWMLRIIDISFINGGVAVTSILLTQNNQRLGDLAAGTTVVKLQSVKKVSSHELIKSLEADEHYVVTFPQVTQLSPEQIRLINQALEANRENAIREPAIRLSEKVQGLLNIQTDMPPIKFLYMVVKDYQYLTSR
ncbi:RDD family protein [Fulvivirga sp.]|uniref:RDD family protein n=1 Tax=Fulvivirga sp. TaxID=1931237 RepID=UPI0032EE194D